MAGEIGPEGLGDPSRGWCATDPAGARDTERAAELLMARLPRGLGVFARLAYDFRCFWHPEGRSLFAEIDAYSWEQCKRNPVRMLTETPTSRLARAAEDRELRGRAEALYRELQEERSRPFLAEGDLSAERPVAFLCSEFGVYPSLPIYSGGLGVLAGDLLKEASDRGVPMVGVGLYYRQGYFHQRLDRSGWQHEYWVETPPYRGPLALVTDEWGLARTVTLRIRDEDVVLQIWRAALGRTSLYLLDANRPENSLVGRWLTSRLYDSERQVRLAQYALLGMGGIRALRALGIDPAVVHLNEGHAALAAFELAREGVAQGLSPADALEAARSRLVFTTHTPVAAGNETYGADELWSVIGELPEELGMSREEILDLGRVEPGNRGEPLGLTVLALRTSRAANGVSRAHGEVARGMWRRVWPDRSPDEIPIGYVTNGVHVATWMAAPMQELLDRHLGPDWLERAADPEVWLGIDDIPDAELWAVRKRMRLLALEYIRERGMTHALARGEPPSRIELMGGGHLSPDALTLGFSRRLASYKRLDLLTRRVDRYRGLLSGARPIQVVVAGKAHPLDEEGKRVLANAGARIVPEEKTLRHSAFVEDYDMAVATRMVAGCDVWLNLPRPPLEASGTSGMKAVLNGALHLSVLDGWWVEGFDGSNGWAIPADPPADEAERDDRDAGVLADILEKEVLPLFYERDASGVPLGWVRRMKSSLRTHGPRFCTARMLDDYVRDVYTKR